MVLVLGHLNVCLKIIRFLFILYSIINSLKKYNIYSAHTVIKNTTHCLFTTKPIQKIRFVTEFARRLNYMFMLLLIQTININLLAFNVSWSVIKRTLVVVLYAREINGLSSFFLILNQFYSSKSIAAGIVKHEMFQFLEKCTAFKRRQAEAGNVILVSC